MLHRRPKSIDAPVINSLIKLEMWAYIRCDQWKKKYRWTLVNDFRQHITNAKVEAITGFELHAKLRNEKMVHYSNAYAELAIVESDMNIMVHPDIMVMSEKEWSDCAIQIDNIRDGLSRLINSLAAKGAGGSESLNFGTESASASYKDA